MKCYSTLFNAIVFSSALLLTQIATQKVFAADSLSTKIHNQYESLRAMGMGNAFTTVADTYSSMLYNPASLAKKRRGEIQFTLAGAGVATNTMTFMKDLQDAEKSATTESQKATAIGNALENFYGKALGGRIQALEMFWVRPNWGVALIPVDMTLDMSINRQLGPSIDLNVKKDTTIAYGYGKQINNTDFSLGATARLSHRDSISQTVSAIELANDSNVLSAKRFKEGINFDVDIGFLWTPTLGKTTYITTETRAPQSVKKSKKTAKKTAPPPVVALSSDTRVAVTSPGDATISATSSTDSTTAATNSSNDATAAAAATSADSSKAQTETTVEVTKEKAYQPLAVSFVARNLISAGYTKSTLVNKDATETPDNNPRVIDIGVGYEFVQWGDLRLRTTAEAKNLLHPYATVRKSTHVGFEVDYDPSSWFKSQFRLGLNQMYFTGGITLLLGVLEIDLATYGEEVGTDSTKIQNRVNALKIGMNF